VTRRRKRQSKRAGLPETKTTTTPLEEIMSSLQNPYHWPSACVGPIIETLIQALITQRLAQKTNSVFRSQWPPSQQSILQTLTTFCNRIPAARVLPATILSSQVFVKVVGAYSHSCQGLNALLSLVKYFGKEFPCDNLLYMKCVLGIVQCLDNMDVMHKHMRQRDKNKSPKLPLSSEQRPTKRSQSSSTCASVELLHGDFSDDDKSHLAVSIANRRKLSHRLPPPPYLKSILTTPVDSNVSYAPAEQAGDWRRLRSKCINTFVATCQKSTRAEPSLLHSVLDDMAPSLVRSPSVRLCILLLVDQQETNNSTNGKFGYSQLCQYWWSRVRPHDCSNASLYLLAYAELIVEGSYFDLYDTCASAVNPLLDHLRQCCTPEQDPNRRESARPYLHCFAYILSHRGKMLGSLSELELRSLLARLSVVFDQPSDWIRFDIAPDERERTMQTLQLAGILGVCDDIEANVCEPGVLGLSPDHEGFPPSICIRNAARQIPLVPNSVFSKLSPVNEAPPKPSGAGASVQIPMMEYVNKDIVDHIFSYFSYKRIVRMRYVCKEWRSVADSNPLWRSAYHSRYGILPVDKLAHSETAPWKDYFMNKWLAEREIGFCRSKNGWKVRLCGFVECTQILKSRKQLQNHHVTHQVTKRKRPVKKKPNERQTSKRQCHTK
jgi:hypothetical protein